MSKLVLDKIKNPDIPEYFKPIEKPLNPKIENSSNNVCYPNLLLGSYYIHPLANIQSSSNCAWWIPTSDVYAQWYESAYKAALQTTKDKNSTRKDKLKYFKRKLEVIDAKFDSVKVANAQNELSTLMKSLKCDLCNAVMNSTLQAKLHYQGKPHHKKASMFLHQSVKKLKHKNNQLSNTAVSDWDSYCEVCKTWFTSQTDASQHYVGKKHLKIAFGLNHTKAIKRGQSQANTAIDSINQFVSQSLQSYITHLQCELCRISVNHQDQLGVHKLGTKHSIMLKYYGLPQMRADSVAIFSKSIDYSIYRTPSGQYYCGPCNMSLNSEITFRTHMESKKHKNQINSKQQILPSLLLKKL